MKLRLQREPGFLSRGVMKKKPLKRPLRRRTIYDIQLLSKASLLGDLKSNLLNLRILNLRILKLDLLRRESNCFRQAAPMLKKL
jgi:hypothetical protein